MRYLRTSELAGWMVALLMLAVGMVQAEEPTKTPAAEKPPWQRYLQGEDAKKVVELEKQLAELQEAGKFAEALKTAETLSELRSKVQGSEHWQALNARMTVVAIRCVLRQAKTVQQEYSSALALQHQVNEFVSKGQYRQAQPLLAKVLIVRRKVLGEEHPDTATSYDDMALNQSRQGKYAEAASGFHKALAIRIKILGEDHPHTANSYVNLATNQHAQGKYAQAEEGYGKALAIYLKVLGEEHPNTARCYTNVASLQHAQGKYAQAEEGFRKALAISRKTLGEDHLDTATNYNNLASNQYAQGKYAQSEEGNRKALAIFLSLLGEEHPYSAQSYNNLSHNQNAQGKYADAEKSCRKALAIRLKVLGEEHPDTAQSYHSLAINLEYQGKYAQAEEADRKALTIRTKVLGEDHPDTAATYNSLALIQSAQAKYAEAEESYRKALTIRRKVLGEEHPDTATSYNNLASNQHAQGKYAEAEEGFRKALAIRRKLLGDEHLLTVASYESVAGILDAQGKYKEAEEGFRKVLAIHREVLGEEHLVTANSYGNVASNHYFQGKYAEAEQGLRKALAIHCKVLGEEHPHTARSYHNIAVNQYAQGKYAQAEETHRKALTIRRKILGGEHFDTAASYSSVAACLYAQGKYAEAESLWRNAADTFGKARLRIAASGLERASKTGEESPLPVFAAVLARNGKPQEAWQHFEKSLGRGTWDDLSAQLRRPADEQARQIALVNRLNRLDQLIERTLSPKADTDELKKRREELLTQSQQTQDELDAFTRHLEKTYGPAAGQIFNREEIQAALAADTALIGWLDIPGQAKAANPNGEHWAVLLRATGEPVWVRLQGSGDKDTWTETDGKLPAALRAALQSPRGDWQPLARRLAEQRLKPLAKHLDGVRRLIVLPSTALAGVPLEVIADGYSVSYAPSGTLYAHLHLQAKPTSKGLLALADPVFDPPNVVEKPLPLPPGGLLLTMVIPGANAARAGLKPNDVLLRYNGSDLHRPADLKPLPEAKEADKRVTVTVWREGETFEKELPQGKLGVVVADEPAPQALTEQHQWDRRLASATRGGDMWQQLPGTRAEVEALRRLFDEPASRLLTDSQASEQRLYELAASGELGRYRYLHLATHGEVDDRMPLRSAVILSRDTLPDPQKQLQAGHPVYDGQLTALEVLRLWHLNSELVTLSACQTALGKYERGEGFVGFAQALILSGSRSVCLSLWKVDDAATALLMERFYQNLLGQREGLRQPLGKAAALAEAKAWLRSLSRQQALERAASLSKGVARGKGRPVQPLLPSLPATAKDEHPYAHPYYWAAFVLMGDPD